MAQLFDITVRHSSLPGGSWSLTPYTLDVSQPIQTITKKAAGSRTAITEIVGPENYTIRMEGLIRTAPVDGYESTSFPAEFLSRMANLARARAAVEVSCIYLSYFGIRQVVFRNFTWKVLPGRPQEFRYTIQAISDDAPELQILRF